jgi:alpha-galactosidase
VLRGGEEPVRVDVKIPASARILTLHVGDGGDGAGWDHADWAAATITLRSGREVRLDMLRKSVPPFPGTRYPFSFIYGGKPSDTLLPTWRAESGSTNSGDALESWRTWTDPETGLRVRWKGRRHRDYADCEWVMFFENTGSQDTPILENVQALNFTIGAPLGLQALYDLHRSKGGLANPTDYEPSVIAITNRQVERLGADGGKSSNRDFPFFKIESGEGSYIVAVGWSGQWAAKAEASSNYYLRVVAGMEQTHFTLHPRERVRTPRVLLFYESGDTLECNAKFRQLIYQHYAARRNGELQLPTLFCNTCFTRGGGWLNECNASNQISLIRAYAPLGLEALITDAGWFEGGWPAGAGNWTPRHDAYPQGMGPVAAAAKRNGMVYGLWFEPERVVADTEFHRQHPEWVLTDGKPGQKTLLANFGLPEVQEYFFNVVKGFMDLPGFRFYRQDFNMNPLWHWRHNDTPDRQGITEMKYIEGLYAYWDRIATTWPDSLREECAGGGRRIDLETLRRMPLHQKSDYWLDNEVDQASLWSLSQYLPNNLITVPLARLDDYSFHSALASSLIPAWIADAPGFDEARAKKLLDRYRELRHLLVGAWYPLLPYSRSQKDWIAMQFHREDLQEGMVLVFRRSESPFRTLEVSFHGLEPDAIYEISFDSNGSKQKATGAQLMKVLALTIEKRPGSDLVCYRKVKE